MLPVVMCALMASCKKSNDGPNRAELLTAHPWYLKQITVQSPGQPDSPFPPALLQCRLDDTLRFLPNHTTRQSWGADSCGQQQPAWFPGSWQLSADGTTLTYETYPRFYTEPIPTYQVRELSETVLRLGGGVPFPAGSSLTNTLPGEYRYEATQ